MARFNSSYCCPLRCFFPRLVVPLLWLQKHNVTPSASETPTFMHMKFSLVFHKATRGLTTCLLDGLLVYLDWRESLRLKVIARKKKKNTMFPKPKWILICWIWIWTSVFPVRKLWITYALTKVIPHFFPCRNLGNNQIYHVEDGAFSDLSSLSVL